MQRYFIKNSQINENYVIMTKDDSYHIIKVMRMKIDEKIELCTENKTYLAKIYNFSDNIVTAQLLEEIEEDKELSIDVTIAQGTVNRVKMEEVIEKLAMLGTSKYIFFQMERSIIKTDQQNVEKKMPRYLSISKESSEVAHRQKVMEIEYLNSMKHFIDYSKNYDICLYAYEKTEFSNQNFKRILKTLKNTHKKILILIGPEGGISEKEVEMLNKNNFQPITLGPRILRTEVAPTYVMASISYELELEE